MRIDVMDGWRTYTLTSVFVVPVSLDKSVRIQNDSQPCVGVLQLLGYPDGRMACTFALRIRVTGKADAGTVAPKCIPAKA